MPFHLNGQAYSTQELQAFALSQLQLPLPQWEVDLYRFILEWLGVDEHITVHTSGSTGTPKAINLPKDKVRNSALMTANYLGLADGSVALLSLSAQYIAGKMMIVRAIENGWHLWAVEPSNQPLMHFNPTINIDLVAWVPSQLSAMLQADDWELLGRIHAIRNIILGGSPVLPALEAQLQDFPNNVYETFGMTETISHIAMRRLNGPEASGYFETTDPGIILGQDDRDCLVVIAPALTNQPVVTNDIVQFEGDRHFRWLGRVDNVVNSGGIKLFPEALEQKIQPLLPQRFFLAGIADVQLGQKLVMVIEAPELKRHELESLQTQLQTVLTRFEMPRNIYTVPHLEETATHKINRWATLAKLGVG